MFVEFTTWDIVRNLLLAMRWTVLLSILAFAGGAVVTALLLWARLCFRGAVEKVTQGYIDLFQGTPVLMQLFLVFFAFPLIGIEVSPWTAAGLCLTLYASAFMLDIWKGSIDALPRGQWEACRVLGLTFTQTFVRVIAPQATRIALAPTVGFLVQLVKNTALTSIIGFEEMTKISTVMTNATFEPFKIYGLCALGYFLLCFPLSWCAHHLEGKLKCRS
ncbi:amino acid ABC transporter permease [Sutterella sp.]|uniref:amino acid ABC transporter permease n=1 Tax=Sutterella sp. TaxID=1981025 RepID=UPI0026E044A8|nr:amino acid ABC transporter permease [Sutterella sp.]MDO5531967.1 amino acid ABC transporter permease [Sutterella sp.]